MVVFSCESCGSSLKKNQIEKHTFQCRGKRFSCMDCTKDFSLAEANAHYKCISEEEKYSGKNYVPKENKGEVKQQKWFEQVQEAIQSVNPKHHKLTVLLNQLINYPNIPRKKQKFVNFLANSIRIRDAKLADEAWEAISSVLNKTSSDNQPNNGANSSVLNKTSSDSQPNNESDKNSKKRKHDENNDEQETTPKKAAFSNGDHVETQNGFSPDEGNNGEHEKPAKFKWSSAIKSVLKTQPDQEMKLKRLKKRVIAAYLQSNAAKNHQNSEKVSSQDELEAIFGVKLQKFKKVRIVNDRVRLAVEKETT